MLQIVGALILLIAGFAILRLLFRVNRPGNPGDQTP